MPATELNEVIAMSRHVLVVYLPHHYQGSSFRERYSLPPIDLNVPFALRVSSVVAPVAVLPVNESKCSP